ncbi:MAG: helix-turn-helix domain-containing protein [Sphingopyxis sp.]|nr:helix-turn-helix domain-containing protein [Sphingopyxis sp.]
MDLGKAIRDLRKSVGMTQAELATRCGVSRQAIILLESNRGRRANFQRAADVVQLKIAELGRGDDITQQIIGARRKLAWTQVELSRRAGISVPTLRSLEGGGGSVIALSRVIAALAPKARTKKHYHAHWALKRDCRFTPPHIIEKIVAAFGPISVDPCGDERAFVSSDRTITEEENGLTSKWYGNLAFVNPPYSDLTTWINRCVDAQRDGEVQTVIGMFPARTETAVFRDRIFGSADILFLRRRVCFLDEAGIELSPAPFAVMFCIWGGEPDRVTKFAELVGCSLVRAEHSRAATGLPI